MSVTQTVIELEERLWQANREGDGAYYDRVLRDDVLVVSRFGVMGKTDVVPQVQTNRNPYLKTELSGHHVLELGADTALITYRADVVAEVNGSETEFAVLATSVYVREDDGWRSAFHQQTPL